MTTTRDRAIRTLEDGHRAIGELLAGISAEDLTRPGTIGGGDWSAKDLVGHLTSWEEIALDTLVEWRRGARPAIEDVFARRGTDRLNEENVARKASLALQEVWAASRAVHGRLITAIGETTDEEWASGSSYGRPTTLGALLGSVLGAPRRPFAHPSAHLPDLETYVASLSTQA